MVNRAVIKEADGIRVHNGFIRLIFGWKTTIDLEAPKVRGEGNTVDRRDIRAISGAKAFKEGDIYTSEGRLYFARGRVKVFAPVGEPDDNADPTPIPKHNDAAEWPDVAFKVMHGASKDNHRAVFRGVQFEPGRIIGIDGFRIIAADVPTAAQKPIVIERDTLALLKRLKVQTYTVVDGVMYAYGEGWRARLEPLDGQYPDYERLLLGEVHGSFRLSDPNNKDWVDALKLAASTSDNGAVTITTEGNLVGGAVEAEGLFTPPPKELMLGAQYLREALEIIGPEATITSYGDTMVKLSNGDLWGVLVEYRR